MILKIGCFRFIVFCYCLTVEFGSVFIIIIRVNSDLTFVCVILFLLVPLATGNIGGNTLFCLDLFLVFCLFLNQVL